MYLRFYDSGRSLWQPLDELLASEKWYRRKSLWLSLAELQDSLGGAGGRKTLWQSSLSSSGQQGRQKGLGSKACGTDSTIPKPYSLPTPFIEMDLERCTSAVA